MRGAAAGVTLAAALLAGCDALPRDPEGTARRIAREHVLRAGVEPGVPAAAPFVAALAKRVGARADASAAPLETLLARLETGEIDIVVGEFAKDSPWQARVSLAPPVAVRTIGDTAMLTRAAMRNGENRWIMTVEAIARPMTPPGAPR